MPSSEELRARLVADLEQLGAIRSAAVREAFLAVHRERFVPDVELGEVYANKVHVTRRSPRGTPISSSSQPAIMAEMLERLDLHPGLRVLEIGTGTGYNAALLAAIVGPGCVTSVELEPELAERAAVALDGYGVDVVVADARAVASEGGPFDRILLTANSPTVERLWLEQLVDGGLIELPLRVVGDGNSLGEQVVATLRREGDRLRSVSLVQGGFMPLRALDADPGAHPPTHVSVSEYVGGEGRSLASLTGEGLATMRREARRRLVALLLSEARTTRRVATPGPAWSSLLPYLAWAEAPAGTVGLVALRGVALATRNGRSLVVVSGGRRRGVRVDSWGEDGAAAALGQLVGRWQRAGRPTLADVVISVSYGSRPRRPSHGRLLARPDGSWLTLTWPV